MFSRSGIRTDLPQGDKRVLSVFDRPCSPNRPNSGGTKEIGYKTTEHSPLLFHVRTENFRSAKNRTLSCRRDFLILSMGGTHATSCPLHDPCKIPHPRCEAKHGMGGRISGRHMGRQSEEAANQGGGPKTGFQRPSQVVKTTTDSKTRQGDVQQKYRPMVSNRKSAIKKVEEKDP